jgi:hypothetical protein
LLIGALLIGVFLVEGGEDNDDELKFDADSDADFGSLSRNLSTFLNSLTVKLGGS